MARYVLTINGGSSSVKFALFECGTGAAENAAASRTPGSAPGLQNTAPVRKSAGSVKSPDPHEALAAISKWLAPLAPWNEITAIGHRIVHGGLNYTEHARVTPELLAELKRISPIDPDHLPAEIALIEALQKQVPNTPQVACFDTAFHRDLPAVAKTLPIPRKYAAQGIRRYGFHGLSYAYLMDELTRQAGAEAARGRIVLAHLGAGASMAAVCEGKCIDTTMSFTPTAGLVMATRCGDLDPGVLVYLMRQEMMTADQIDHLINGESGLLGISGVSADMKKLLDQRGSSQHAAEAVDIFCYQARKWIGALAAALGGLDTLVFSGGIGEHAAEVRSVICRGLEHLGIQLDDSRNAKGAAVISAAASATSVRVIATDEEAMIVNNVCRLLAS